MKHALCCRGEVHQAEETDRGQHTHGADSVSSCLGHEASVIVQTGQVPDRKEWGQVQESSEKESRSN